MEVETKESLNRPNTEITSFKPILVTEPGMLILWYTPKDNEPCFVTVKWIGDVEKSVN